MMRFSLFTISLSVLLMTACASGSQAQSSAEPAAYEMPNSQVVPIKNSKNGGQYELYIKLPEEYAENQDTAYPVIYYADAVWHLEMLSAATEYMLKDVILVGISWRQDIADDLRKAHGDHASRFTDYSFWEKTNPNHPKLVFGQANNHLAFIRDDVIHYVDSNYRTDPDSRTYFGYSLSGAFGAYALLTQPDSFDNYILGSPLSSGLIPYLVEIDSELGTFEANHDDSLNANVFIAYGTLEQGAAEATDDFIKLLGNRRKLGVSIQTEAVEGDHQTAFPRVSLESVAWLSSLIRDISSDDPDLSFTEVPILNKAFVSTAPEDRKDGILVGELGVDAGDKDKILTLAKEIADRKHGRFDSFLIAHKDKLIFESYYARGRIDLPHFQASATKAYTGLLLGRAIQLGYLTLDDLNKPLVSFLNDLDPARFVEGAEKITLNHALTMRSGIRISDDQREKMEENPGRLEGQGEVQALLAHSAPITEESQVFKYGGGAGLVMQVIEAMVPGSAQDFGKGELLDKLGITNYRWPLDKQSGLPVSGSQAKLTSRDMVKFGTLASNKGQWNGEQLIPEAFIARATDRILTTDSDYEVHYGGKDVSNQGYGYFWWSADLRSSTKRYFTSSAQGGYGQFIILIAELDLMVVFTAHDNDTNYLQLTAERILPAFIE